MKPGEKFSGARQGVRYRGNDGHGTIMLGEKPEQPTLFDDVPYEDLPKGFGNSLQPIHAESVEWGHTATERPHDPTQWNGQMALRGMPKPTDPNLHRLRQQNPHLNDYQFKYDSTENPRKVAAYDATGTRVGKMELGYEQFDWDTHPGHREVESIGVASNHAGKGLGEAMYDLARMRGTKIVHSYHRSESGEAFARRVGGPQFNRTMGHGQDDYLGHNPDPARY